MTQPQTQTQTYSTTTTTAAANATTTAAANATTHRAATAAPAVIDRPSTMAGARAVSKDYARDPVRRASDAAHAGATLTLVTGPKFGAKPQRRQILTYSHPTGWMLNDAEAVSVSVAYHMLRGADSIDIERA